jgi:hypothetical protein
LLEFSQPKFCRLCNQRWQDVVKNPRIFGDLFSQLLLIFCHCELSPEPFRFAQDRLREGTAKQSLTFC